MELQDLKSKLVAVLGYGLEGKSTAAYLIKHGIKPVLFDQKAWDEWSDIDKSEIEKLGVNFIFGPDCFKELAGFDVAFRSPGINPKQLTINNLQLTSQSRFFFDNCPAKIIGVTGTKGKGTTCTLIYEMLKADGKSAYLTGNIGKVQPLEILDGLKPSVWIVYELSSFQLQDLEKSPHIGVVLMVTSEHLDYHTDQNEYVEAKSSITKFQTPEDFAIINADYENSLKIGRQGKGKKIFFGRTNEFLNFNGRQNLETKMTVGTFIKDGQIVCENLEFHFPVAGLQLRGAHNLENACAAVLAAGFARAGNEAIKQALVNFKGLEHRLEFVAGENGIKFYNDSFSTTPETAIAAIKSFTEPEIVILGGSSKNSDFSELGKTIVNAKNIKAVILIGQEAGRIKLAINRALDLVPHLGGRKEFWLENAQNMGEIFAQIKSVAVKGDIVLLSPACASFGMFKNYKDRGGQFKNAIKEF